MSTAGTPAAPFDRAPFDRVRAVLCDADGNLFPSEEPAFVASAEVTNRFLAEHGVDRRYGAEELRLATTGLNFRSTLAALAREHGVGALPAAEVEAWVRAEREEVTAHLGTVLRPDPAVVDSWQGVADLLLPALARGEADRGTALTGATR